MVSMALLGRMTLVIEIDIGPKPCNAAQTNLTNTHIYHVSELCLQKSFLHDVTGQIF